jgi:arsenate reductase
MLFIEYPKCSTSNRAKKWLNDNAISYSKRNIKDDNPKFEELKKWFEESDLEIKKFFNTSGKLYRKQKIKDIFNTATTTELLTILSSDGMMVKRPILIGDNFILVGFKEDVWSNTLLR